MGQLFQKNGYFTARVGKIYHYGVPTQIGTDGLDDKPSWNMALNPNGVDHTREEPLLTNYTPNRGLGSAVCFHASKAKDDEHTDGMVANEAVRLLEQHGKEPFFIAAGFYRPHVPWIAPVKYFDQYPLSNIELIPYQEGEMRIAPELAYFTKPAHWGMDEKQRKEAMRAYYASIAFLDAQVGKLLDTPGTAAPGGGYHHRFLERSRLPARRTRAVDETDAVRGLGARAHDHERRGRNRARQRLPPHGGIARSLSHAGRCLRPSRHAFAPSRPEPGAAARQAGRRLDQARRHAGAPGC